MFAAAACIPPASFKQVKSPRDGRPLNNRICLVYSQRYQINFAGLERLHPFDINKYSKIYLHLQTDGIIQPSDVFVPQPVSRHDLLLVHSPEYLRDLQDSAKIARYLEFGPLAIAPAAISDAAILRPFRYATGGTILAARLALQHGMAINLGGGYHHAEPDRGGGFCIYADMPIAIRVLMHEGAIHRALVVDLDVHQGNGTALCVAEDDRVFTFDMHESDIYPIPKQRNDLDVPLPAYTTDSGFLTVLRENLPRVFDVAQPDIVFFQAGVDGLEGDPLANFMLTEDGIIERDRAVFDEAQRRGIPIVMVLGGGYSEDAWRVQYHSIRNLIEHYGDRSATASPGRSATLSERLYTK
jgi:histone deacetylase 11